MSRTKQEITTFDKIQANLFGHDTKMVLSDKEQEIFLRYRAGFSAWLEDPTITDKQMATLLMNTFGIAKQTAYLDVGNIKRLVGNVQNASKEFHRYTVIKMLKEAFLVAKHKHNPVAMAMAADKLAKATQLDKIDMEIPDWNAIIPPSFEPSSDVRLIGLKPMQDLQERIKQLKQKYISDYIEEVQDDQVIYLEATPDE